MFDFDGNVYVDDSENEWVSGCLFKSKPEDGTEDTAVETLPCVVLLEAELYALDKCSDVGGMLSLVSCNRIFKIILGPFWNTLYFFGSKLYYILYLKLKKKWMWVVWFHPFYLFLIRFKDNVC